jgi:hypothetical protein
MKYVNFTRRTVMKSGICATSVAALGGMALPTLVAPTAAQAEVPSNGSIDTPVGKLEVVNGYPSDATVTKLFDEMDFSARHAGLSLGSPLHGNGAMAGRTA